MSKCKRNVILIFGYLLIMGILFIPCKRIYYSFGVNEELKIERKRLEGKQGVFFLPFIIKRVVGLERHKNWVGSLRVKILSEQEKFRDYLLKNLKNEIEKENKELEEEIKQLKKSNTYKIKPVELAAKEIVLEMNKEALLDKDAMNTYIGRRIRRNASKIREKNQEELNEKFKNKQHFYKIHSEHMISVISIIFLIEGFAYILFCVVLKREKRGEK